MFFMSNGQIPYAGIWCFEHGNAQQEKVWHLILGSNKWASQCTQRWPRHILSLSLDNNSWSILLYGKCWYTQMIVDVRINYMTIYHFSITFEAEPCHEGWISQNYSKQYQSSKILKKNLQNYFT